jgi:hypothetical protein
MQFDRANDRRFTLRLERDLREALTAEARRQMRSLNSEIHVRLRQTLERHQPELRGREQASAS